MIYRDFQDKRLSQLGFGLMRLPTRADGSIDEAQVQQMAEDAMAAGVNYFDTAWPYHGGMSEAAIGRALKKYPRESWYLADKYPGHQIAETYNPAEIFEQQLKKCGVEYFDFYLLHNVYENSIQVYLDEQWGILEYFREQKRLGRIRHLGFSTHAELPCLTQFLDAAGEDMEFCQIQLNYLDWTLQSAREKVALLNERRIPIWVMEPVRGGALSKLSDEDTARLAALRPDVSPTAWGLRFLQDIPGVAMILSGMSSLQHMTENLATFESAAPLTDDERHVLLEIAEGMKKSVPCTACRYCTAYCPMGLDIPMLLRVENELRVAPVVNSAMRLDALPANKWPAACIGCGRCMRMCPQRIDIPGTLRDLAKRLETMPRWADICRERAEAAKRAAEALNR